MCLVLADLQVWAVRSHPELELRAVWFLTMFPPVLPSTVLVFWSPTLLGTRGTWRAQGDWDERFWDSLTAWWLHWIEGCCRQQILMGGRSNRGNDASRDASVSERKAQQIIRALTLARSSLGNWQAKRGRQVAVLQEFYSQNECEAIRMN